MANTIAVLNSTGGTVTVRTAFDQTSPIAGAQMGLTVVAATGLTVPGGATTALISVEGQNVRWRDDGTNPTAGSGMIMYAGAAPQVFSGNLSAVKFIQTAASATLNVSYYT